MHHDAGRLTGTRKAIYLTLRGHGLSRHQALGIMANMQNESGFHVETNVVDSNGLRSYGLICWNAGSYPDAHRLVTGHVGRDIRAQVDYLLHHTNNFGLAMAGHTAHDVAGRWAQYVEVCRGCEPGGNQWSERTANADVLTRLVD